MIFPLLLSILIFPYLFVLSVGTVRISVAYKFAEDTFVGGARKFLLRTLFGRVDVMQVQLVWMLAGSKRQQIETLINVIFVSNVVVLPVRGWSYGPKRFGERSG